MISNEDKTKLLKSIVTRMQNGENGANILSELNSLLLKDTNKGKLYRYRAFNENNLNSVEEQTFYGSQPSSFNDPFDSKIGLDLQSMFMANSNLELDKVFDKVLEDYFAIISKQKKLNDCLPEYRQVLVNLLQNERINVFFSELRPDDMTQEKLCKLMQQDKEIVFEIMSAFIVNGAVRSQMPISSSIIKQIEGMISDMQIETYNTPLSYNNFAKSMGVDYDGDEITLTKKIYLHKYPNNPSPADEMDKKFEEIYRMICNTADKYRIVCLTTDYKNRLMWSHYADSHKGFCVEYDFSSKDFDNYYSYVFPVIYSSIRPKFPWDAYIDPNIKTGSAAILLSLLTKDEAWSYEREWRILVPLSSENTVIPAPPITCIYLGALCSQKNRELIMPIAKKLRIPVKQMVVDRGEYNLCVEPIE